MSAALNVVGGGIGMVGAIQKGESASATSRLNQAEFDRQSNLETASAVDVERRGGLEAGRIRMDGSQMAAKQSLAYSNSGVDASVGTPSSTIAGSQLFNELDAKTAENNAAREAWGHKELGRQYAVKSRAEVARQGAIRDAEITGAFGALLGGGASAAATGGGE